MALRKDFFTQRAARHWQGLPRAVGRPQPWRYLGDGEVALRNVVQGGDSVGQAAGWAW